MGRSLDELIEALQWRLAMQGPRVDCAPSLFHFHYSQLSPLQLLGEAKRLGEARRRADAKYRAALDAAAAGRSIDLRELVAPEAMKLAAEMSRPGPLPDLAPATSDALASAEHCLGLAFPEPFRRIYRDYANGRFGPDRGLLPVELITKRTLDARRVSREQFGAEFPAQFVMLQDYAPYSHCLDCSTGEVVAWDSGEIASLDWDEVEPAELVRVHDAAFSVVSPSLTDWLWSWLQGPSEEELAEEQAAIDAALQRARQSWNDQIERQIVEMAAMTPQERAARGLGGDDWEEQMRSAKHR